MPKDKSSKRTAFRDLSSEYNIRDDSDWGVACTQKPRLTEVDSNRPSTSNAPVKSFQNQNQTAAMNGMPSSAALKEFKFVEETSISIKKSIPDLKALKQRSTPYIKPVVKKKHYCNFCEYSTNDGSNFTRHMRKHTQTKPYKCPKCELSFSQSNDVKRHLLVHSGLKQFHCDLCHDVFTQKGHLVTHLNYKHSGLKMFKCDSCENAFSNSSDLKRHMKFHLEVKNYLCDQCPYACVTSADLAKHKRTHSGLKPFICDSCPTKFANPSNLISHQQLHSKSKIWRYECPYEDHGLELYDDDGPGQLLCGSKFPISVKLDYHILYHHTKEGLNKRQSESQMATFFEENEIDFDRDRVNTLSFAMCMDYDKLDESKKRVRPDFYLTVLSTMLGMHILVGNDEMEHRRYRCDFQRTLDIYGIVSFKDDFANPIPLVYIRLNPHFYDVLKGDGKSVRYDPKIGEVFKKLLLVFENLKAEKYGQLSGLNLIYINYSICNDARDIPHWQKLSVFNKDVGDSNQNFSLPLQSCILDVLY